MNNNLISKLKEHSGFYSGHGINHEGQPFTGTFAISEIVGGVGISIAFKAVGEEGTIYHEEFSTVAPDLTGKIGLYNLNSNMPGLVHHILLHCEVNNSGDYKAIFSFGQRSDTQSFREEITLEIIDRDSVGYRYAWGMPGGEFADRSGVIMKRI